LGYRVPFFFFHRFVLLLWLVVIEECDAIDGAAVGSQHHDVRHGPAVAVVCGAVVLVAVGIAVVPSVVLAVVPPVVLAVVPPVVLAVVPPVVLAVVLLAVVLSFFLSKFCLHTDFAAADAKFRLLTVRLCI
jgi:hypothetical protein